ncbi:hypothetical protein BAUCODRAFT_410976 [Baudoinia panamericana UAMH 10762]|uniref:Uncharacterized protein n=1 Tax=Baudoinia panamericana (strain UAMH 10762) TaxID=717646 RepID=M2NGC4_BAUPA|nr:uncharacterized protein BAUCODRAFT_410976 [Baudoinia panamericana UAMH 10762]EMC98025.1 hypothetical protein BAUCODRAFT_410976 [Baudoinia panamericana UAMH 10762]
MVGNLQTRPAGAAGAARFARLPQRWIGSYRSERLEPRCRDPASPASFGQSGEDCFVCDRSLFERGFSKGLWCFRRWLVCLIGCYWSAACIRWLSGRHVPVGVHTSDPRSHFKSSLVVDVGASVPCFIICIERDQASVFCCSAALLRESLTMRRPRRFVEREAHLDRLDCRRLIVSSCQEYHSFR